ncbi:acyl carrier protein [Erwinia amylovora]|uniref:Acyl carrier protein (ACP) n=3 Tax=Erwinia amylovora TaxID=552 RepID=A0A831ET76_ERWAM|nr:acyl carrier protein [Erwinia amylovora]CDK15097.1 Acyl carrier protein (ACP) [Erwinia amylovora LA635]CDK18465.1 Acyl carrier protein (ACP) [Erwinia amylovora LA636]CDK21834.1 Acyl carrier protein (ACP) [Erwinia amylovora LA637]ATZ11412.1 acyl carrier protein [Erwinia amylovora]EKV54300.1 Acyl carrier protein (ACP) [Erwinia amylovora ACW56400]
MKNVSSFSTVTHLIQQINGSLPQHVTLQHSLIKDLKMDSVELIDLFLRLEQAGIIMDESQISSQLTVGDIVKLIEGTDA